MGAEEEDWTSGVQGLILGLSALAALGLLTLAAGACWACGGRRTPAASGTRGKAAGDGGGHAAADQAAPKPAEGPAAELPVTQVVPVRPAARGEWSTTRVEPMRPSDTTRGGEECGEGSRSSMVGSSPSEEGSRLGTGDSIQVVKECSPQMPGQVDDDLLNKAKVYQGPAPREADGAAAVAWPATPPVLASLGQRSALPPILGQVAPVSASRSFTDKGRRHKGTQLDGAQPGGRRCRKSKDAADRAPPPVEGGQQEAAERVSRAAPSEVGAHSLWAESEIL